MAQLRILIVYLFVIALFVAAHAFGLRTLSIALKPIPVALLALVVWRGAKGPIRVPAAMGLALCAVGDWVIDTQGFVPGLIAFLLGHVAYVASFVSVSRELRLVRAIPFIAWGAIAIAWLWPNLGAMRLPVALYTTTICTMMWRAISLIEPKRPSAKLIAIGAVIFAASDTIIAIDRFHAHFRGARVAILALYWLGQCLLARGVVKTTS